MSMKHFVTGLVCGTVATAGLLCAGAYIGVQYIVPAQLIPIEERLSSAKERKDQVLYPVNDQQTSDRSKTIDDVVVSSSGQLMQGETAVNPFSYTGARSQSAGAELIIGKIEFDESQPYVRRAKSIPFTIKLNGNSPLPNNLYVTYIHTEDANYFVPGQGVEYNNIVWKKDGSGYVFQDVLRGMNMTVRGSEGSSKSSNGLCVDLYVIAIDPAMKVAAVNHFGGDVQNHVVDRFSTQSQVAYVSSPVCLNEFRDGIALKLEMQR